MWYSYQHKGIGNVSKSFVLFATFMRGQDTQEQSKVAKYTKNLATLLWPEERCCCQVQPSEYERNQVNQKTNQVPRNWQNLKNSNLTRYQEVRKSPNQEPRPEPRINSWFDQELLGQSKKLLVKPWIKARTSWLGSWFWSWFLVWIFSGFLVPG